MSASRRFPGLLGPATEAVAFSAGVLIYIWVLQSIWPWSVLVLLLGTLISFRQHAETLNSLGLGLRAFLSAMRHWRVWWLVSAAGIVWLGWNRSLAPEQLRGGAYYALWCVCQQLIYQNMVYKRLAEAMGHSGKTRAVATALFSVVHLPNPVLVPATLVWGLCSSYLFEQRRSVPALGLLQFLFSGILFWLAPIHWHHGFRVGPGYSAWHPPTAPSNQRTPY